MTLPTPSASQSEAITAEKVEKIRVCFSTCLKVEVSALPALMGLTVKLDALKEEAVYSGTVPVA